jgi:hypothetical protein
MKADSNHKTEKNKGLYLHFLCHGEVLQLIDLKDIFIFQNRGHGSELNENAVNWQFTPLEKMPLLRGWNYFSVAK